MSAGSEIDPDRRAARTVLAFNEAITQRDVAVLGHLMTDDHTFIDSDENLFSGKEEVLGAWRGFFDAFPDYQPQPWRGFFDAFPDYQPQRLE